MKPFEQMRFEDVPDSPRIPHPYYATPAREVRVDSVAFGPVDVHVRVVGQGPPLLLVHGFMTSSYSWRYVLAELGSHYTLYVPDLVGAGRSSKPDRSYHPDDLADFIGELIAKLGIRGTRVVGNSLGGYLCMRLALRDAGAMGRLVNLHSPGVPTARMRLLAAALNVVPMNEKVVRALVWRNPERWVHKNVHYVDDTLKSREEHREYAAPLKEEAGVRAFHRMLSETLAARHMQSFVERLERMRERGEPFPVPLQLLYVSEDPMVPPVVGDKLRALVPSAEFVRLAHGSHFAHVDAPSEFLAAVGPFLARG